MERVNILSRPAASNNWASAEYAAGRRERKVGAIFHWMGGYLPGTTSMFQRSSTGYSTSLGVGSRDGKGNGLEVHRYVPADGYAYGSYNADADRRGESIEIENDYWKPYPGKPTYAVHELVARLLAQLCIDEDWPLIDGRRQLVLGDFPDHRFYRKSIPGFGVDFNVTTHRSMALKDCPGTTDVALIVRLGNDYLEDDMPLSNEDPIVKTILHRLDWLTERVGGSSDGPSVTDELRYLKGRTGGSGTAPSLTDFARQHRDGLTAIGSRLDAIGAPSAPEEPDTGTPTQ